MVIFNLCVRAALVSSFISLYNTVFDRECPLRNDLKLLIGSCVLNKLVLAVGETLDNCLLVCGCECQGLSVLAEFQLIFRRNDLLVQSRTVSALNCDHCTRLLFLVVIVSHDILADAYL